MGRNQDFRPRSATTALAAGMPVSYDDALKTCNETLAAASQGSIDKDTPDDKLLSLFIIPDKIGFLYIALNKAFKPASNFKLLGSGDIPKNATVGAVRKTCCSHCGFDYPKKKDGA